LASRLSPHWHTSCPCRRRHRRHGARRKIASARIETPRAERGKGNRRMLVDGPIVLAVAGVLLLVIARQVMMLRDNQRLMAELRSFNENLEQMVARRTEQLAALNRLSSEVSSSLELEQVLDVAARHAREALRGDA